MNTFEDQSTNLNPGFFQFSAPPPRSSVSNRVPDEAVSGVFSKENQVFKEYKMYDDTSIKSKNYAYEALLGVQEVGRFSLLFFSQANTKEIQKLLKYRVYIASDKTYRIDNQNETELVIIMKAVYLQYSKVPGDLALYKAELHRLNNIVLDQLMPDLMSNITQYIYYIRDSNSSLRTMDRPENMSQAGLKASRDILETRIGMTTNEFNRQFEKPVV